LIRAERQVVVGSADDGIFPAHAMEPIAMFNRRGDRRIDRKMKESLPYLVVIAWLGAGIVAAPAQESPAVKLSWSQLPALPDPLGVAGPFAGVHEDALIVAGGANFPRPVWQNDKVWQDAIHVLVRDGGHDRWLDGGKLPRKIAYGAAVSTAEGVLCMGGNDAENTFRDVFLLQFDRARQAVRIVDYPSLPAPCAYASAAMLGKVIYLIGGQSGSSLESATQQVWTLDLSRRDDPDAFSWQRLEPMPAARRAFHLTLAQQDGAEGAIYVISGRRQQADTIEFLRDVWQFTPSTGRWRRRADCPRCVMAGTGMDWGPNQLLVLGGADGSRFHQADQLRDEHPGFPKQAWAYHIDADHWTSAGQIPSNQVTTIAVRWNDSIVIPSGEVRPRVRSATVWQVRVNAGDKDLGMNRVGNRSGGRWMMVGNE
jgi:N-acetylneuraminic acid mutarotase